jgi:hypothetical protein
MESQISLSCSQQPANFPILSQKNTLHAIPTCFFKIKCKSSSYLPNGVFSSGLHFRSLYWFLFCSVCAMCPIHFTSLDLLTLIIFGRKQTTEREAPHYAIPFSIFPSLPINKADMSSALPNSLTL